ncbi:ROK family protein, partial [Clostridium chrysemydis]
MDKLVLDIGGSAIKYALMDKDLNILKKGEEKTPLDSLNSLIKTIFEIYKKHKNEVDGIALSMPGNIDSKNGQIYQPGAILYNANINIIQEINKLIDIPVSVENDGKSAALAEAFKGNLSNCSDGVVLILGTGVGGGIIKDKKIHKGSHFFAGEFSFILGEDQKKGFEDVFALKASTQALILEVAKEKGIDKASINGKDVFEMIKENDEKAIKAFDKFTMNLARGIYNIQCILDPEKILIGGGISKQPILLEKIKEKLDDIYKVIPFDIPKANIDTCKYFNDSNLIGA